MASVEVPASPAPSRTVRCALRSRAGAFGPWAAVALLLAGYGLFLGKHFAPAIGSPDANGYWAQGSLLARTGRTWFVPESDVQYVGIHWLVTPDGRYYSRYPPGLAVVVALVYRLFGHGAAVLVNPVLSLCGLLGMFFLGRRAAGPWWGVLGALALAVTPVYVQHSLQCDAHMAVTAALVWGLWFLLRWHQEGLWPDLLAAGLVLGAVPAVRYPEVLCALGAGALVLLHWRRRPQCWKHSLAGLAGALVCMAPLLVRNHLAFGAFWRTGYSLTREQTGFGWEYFQDHALGYVRALGADGVGVFFGLGLAGIALLCCRRQDRPWGLCLALTALPVTLLYMAYYWAPGRPGGEAAALRFVLPTFPCYYAAGLWALQRLAEAAPGGRAAPALALAVGVVHVVWGAFTAAAETPRHCATRKALAVVTRELGARVPPAAVILAPPWILQHLDYVRVWRCADISVARPRPRFGPGRLNRNPDGPDPMQPEKRQIEAEKYAGQTPFGRERAIAYDLRSWAGTAPVYFVGSEDDLRRLPPGYLGERYLEEVARIQLPEVPPDTRQGQRRGPDGMPRRFGPPGPGVPGPGGLPEPGFAPGSPGAPADVPGATAPGPAQGLPPAPRFGRPPGAPAGMMGFSPDTREVILARWTWQPPRPR